ncbi:MAG: hypothetical protein AAFY41_03090, partial [Bacteroidota bacterium]
MNNRAKTSQDIPSIANSGLKVAPYSNSSRFMELHKLDYKRKNLLSKLEKAEKEIRSIKRNIGIIDHDIASIISKVDVQTIKHADLEGQSS